MLEKHGTKYEVSEHQPATTSAEAEDLTGWPMTAGAKAILFKADQKFVLCVVKGSNRVDFKKLRKILKVRKARLATPEEVIDVMGVKIGACYPFPKFAGLDGYVDETLAENELISFSPGTHRHHIRMKFKDYQAITKPHLVDIAASYDQA